MQGCFQSFENDYDSCMSREGFDLSEGLIFRQAINKWQETLFSQEKSQ